MATRLNTIGKEVGTVYLVIFIVWGLYRYLFRLPTVFEELVLKGLVFGGSIAWVAYKNRWNASDLGIRVQELSSSVRWGLLTGVAVGLVGQIGNIVRHKGMLTMNYGLEGEALGTFLLLSIVTAFWEQLVFSGYMLMRLKPLISDEWMRSWVVAFLFVLIHIPALLITSGIHGGGLLILSLILLLLMQLGANLLFYRFNNLAAPILAQALWGVTIYLFR
jgi:hypothetical protein